METIASLIIEYLGLAFFAVIAICVLLVFAGWWTSKLYYKATSISRRVDSLPCARHDSSISRHDDRMADVDKTLARIDGAINALMMALPQVVPSRRDSILSSDVPDLAQKHSPKRLNPNGEKVSSLFGCVPFIAENTEWLLTEVAKFSPKTALDAEMASLAALRVAASDERFNLIKNRIYHSPAVSLAIDDGMEKAVDISLDDVLFVMSLHLRDLYLDRHPELLHVQ